MPHSSGGGSHGGGSHGGSSHGGSGGSSTHHSSKYFTGSHHYAYYKDGKVHHFYNQKPITKESLERTRKGLKIARCIWAAFYLIAIIAILKTQVFGVASKMHTIYSDTDIQIRDTIGWMGDTDALEDEMEEFQELSGITPYILVIPNTEWKGNYTDLETYAYDYYLSEFDDECHWLIVYSTDGDEDWEDWYWEGMQGDNTDPCLTRGNCDNFRESLEKSLRKGKPLEDSLEKAFADLNDTMFDIHFDPLSLIMMFIALPLHAGMMYLPIYGISSSYKIDCKAFELPDAEKMYKEDTCTYCGGMFIHGIHISCPHCGGPLPPAEGLVYIANASQLKK